MLQPSSQEPEAPICDDVATSNLAARRAIGDHRSIGDDAEAAAHVADVIFNGQIRHPLLHIRQDVTKIPLPNGLPKRGFEPATSGLWEQHGRPSGPTRNTGSRSVCRSVSIVSLRSCGA